MALVVLNDDQDTPAALWQAVRALPPGAPVVVMIHGYRFSPHSPQHDPHAHILALNPREGGRRVVSWPRALGFAEADDPREGLAIAFGWEARGNLRAAYGRAGDAGARLARIIDRIAQTCGRPAGLIGHSLGARVALTALGEAGPDAVRRVILLAAAELRARAALALDSPAGRGAEVINVTSRENDLFDLGMELALTGGVRRALGFGLAEARENWLDLQIDDAGTLQALHGMGFRVSGQALRCCHWSPYLRGGVFQLYQSALRDPDGLPLRLLRRHLPAEAAPRWSRLLTRPGRNGHGGGEGEGHLPPAAA